MKEEQIKWIKIGSKGSSYLARYNAAYKAINKYMKEISGISTLLDNYKYIDHTHYGSLSYPKELEKLYSIIHKRIGGVVGYSKLRKDNYKKYLRAIKNLARKINAKISNEKLTKIFLKTDNIYGKANSFLGLGTLYTECLTRKLQKKFGKKYLDFDFSSNTRLSQYHNNLLRLSKIRAKSKLEKAIDKILKNNITKSRR